MLFVYNNCKNRCLLNNYRKKECQNVKSKSDPHSPPSDDVNIAPINTTSIPYTIYFYPIQKNINSDNIKMRFKFGLRWNNSEAYAADKAIVYLQLKDFTYSSTDYSYFEN